VIALAAAPAPSSGPVIPSFGPTDPCVTGHHLFCPGWVRDEWGSTIQPALLQHIKLTAIAVSVGFAIALALALLADRYRPLAPPFGVFAAIVYTIPSLALFQLLVPVTGLTVTTVEIALASYTLIVLFRNTLTGLQSAPPDVLEAARGMGLSDRQMLLRVRLPLAIPAIMAGLRVAVVLTIAEATVASFIIPEGLGFQIREGIRTSFSTGILTAGGLAVLLAFAADGLLVLLQRVLTPWSRRWRVA
jgi:osmoprotectant transport system permease protein